MVKFCENGAKAVNWEADQAPCRCGFFARYSVTALLEQSDYWLEYQGRLTEPMVYDAGHRPLPAHRWDAAFALIARHLNAWPAPTRPSSTPRAAPATKRRTSISCSCAPTAPTTSRLLEHVPRGQRRGPGAERGVGKGTVTFDDFEHADAILRLGQNPGTNHPRMLEPLREAVKRGAQVVCINPLKERPGTLPAPAAPAGNAHQRRPPTNTAYFRPALGGDMAMLRGMAKFLLQWEREAQAKANRRVRPRLHRRAHHGVDEYLAVVDATPWEQIEAQSG
jgi:anaerobic selenocysteine-containing dehydrogenase